ncbi:flippase-like domain-containing protein [Paraburkholderia silviterrae]|uniref:Flippase-like domain-containing protein n=1 Tax=Paraburkholderia silviterrae TaxID=2528715 RepID=A0A4R5M4V9_9BURK|nr:flippase-like domain-containing protein [Paraburkholderia silviterrae]TDG20423.1 flippase-like domain-containing protein [Paraburkholderia silviterrae]
MSRAAIVLMSIGTALFIALLAWQGLGSVTGALAVAGWGLALVAAFHLVPLALDAGAIAVLFRKSDQVGRRDALLARWSGESVNSLLPAGQIGGPVVMVRQLAQRGVPMRDAAAAITVSTTLQALAQIVFAVSGIALFSVYAANGAPRDLGVAALIATGVLGALIGLFYVAQRRGLFGRVLRLASKIFGKRDWSSLTSRADAVDAAVKALYADRARVVASFVLSFVGWLVGTVEVWLALRFLGHPVGWVDALLLESIGQAIRGAAFAIPGSLGVQEGGYLLLAPLVGLPPEAALALSLAKRAREIVLGLPGLLYLHISERSWQRRRAVRVPAVEVAD